MYMNGLNFLSTFSIEVEFLIVVFPKIDSIVIISSSVFDDVTVTCLSIAPNTA